MAVEYGEIEQLNEVRGVAEAVLVGFAEADLPAGDDAPEERPVARSEDGAGARDAGVEVERLAVGRLDAERAYLDAGGGGEEYAPGEEVGGGRGGGFRGARRGAEKREGRGDGA